MADDKTKIGGRDRDLVAGDRDYEVLYLAKETGISVEQARDLIKRHGQDRQTLEREANKLGR